jgi:hypothetical protein
MIQSSHKRENANTIAGRYGICLEFCQGELRGVSLGTEVFRKVDVREVMKGIALCLIELA